MLENSAVWQLTLARLREFVRDPGAVFWTFGFPIVLAVVLGIAFRSTPEPVPKVGLVGLEARPEITTPLLNGVHVDAQTLSRPRAEQALARGDIDVVIEPGDAGHDLTYRYDPRRPEGRVARTVVNDFLQREMGRQDAVAVNDTHVLPPGGRYIDFLVPGLLGLNLMGSAVWGIGFSVVEARRRKLLKRLLASPMRRSDFLLSYMLSRLLFLFAEMVALVGFGALVFDVIPQGSLLTLGLVSMLGALSFTGIALLIAARPASIEAASGWGNFVMLPMWLFSGAFFSYRQFPEFLHPWIRALPLTAAIDAMRAIFNEGATLVGVGSECLTLILWGALSFGIALKTFRWQ